MCLLGMGSTDTTRHDTIRYFIAILFCNVAAAAAVALHGKSRIYIMIIII